MSILQLLSEIWFNYLLKKKSLLEILLKLNSGKKIRTDFSVSLKVAAQSVNTALPVQTLEDFLKRFHERTNFSEYDLQEFIALKLNHRKNLSHYLYQKVTIPKAVSTVGT